MLKLLGGLCVLLSGVLACRNHLGERRRRREALTDFLTALRRMGETVRAARTPLPILLASLASDCGPDGEVFFKSAAGAARSGEHLPEIWRTLAEELPLSEKDRSVIAELGGDLQGDEEQVCRAVSLAVLRLSESAGEAERRRPEEEKRAAALWLSAAALLVILLI